MDTSNTKNSLRRAFVAILFVLSSFGMVAALSAEDPPPLFQELKGLNVPGVKPGSSKVDKPLEINKRKDLKTIFGKGKDMMMLRKSIDFDKQSVLLFRWNGSGKDGLNAKVEPNLKDKTKPRVTFQYVPGLTEDLRFHFKVFALPKDAKWEVSSNKPAVAKAVVKLKPKLGGLIIRADGVALPLPAQAVVKAPPPLPIAPRDGKAGVIRGGLKPAIINGRAVPIANKARSMRIYHQWTGFVPDGEMPDVALPAKGYVADEETWVELWHAWRPMEKVPSVNFQTEILFVGSQVGKSRVYLRAVKTEAGEVTMSVNGSGNVKGLSYSFSKFMREGVISVNGLRLPGAPD
jgi:hypothetical protein